MKKMRGFLIAGALLLLLLALAPLASEAPDGLEYAIENYATDTEAMHDATVTEEEEVPESAAMVVLSGATGTAIVLAVGWAWGWTRRPR